MTSASSPDSSVLHDIGEFTSVLQQHGIHTALQYLNSRTPHRYTGVFRFDGDQLRNEALYDRRDPANVQQGPAAPMEATYCALVGRQQAPLEITDATTDPRVKGVVDTPVVSYCGVLIRDSEGKAFGTLCHYDMQRCQERTTDLPLLEAAADLLYNQLYPTDKQSIN
ncbi:GAF domain protein [Hymenobacter roseosalivarius DSM 11622]|uniref:GAF domain protein n=1 Tax=Hymenobacter roseosalivarius DSM 11622 TaxID=645990 RepID=A0A1W1UV22_9BACT|nr:GAF domain-containing protein [Hymenobacter roseosalivarius]SMB84890.1 GAF domain protein [Hymenobacter roseosalivarius DSM 11622]